MKLPKLIRNLFKNNNKSMITEEQLISYQQNFAGQKFQWIKTDRPELKGKVVKVRDIMPQGDRCFAVFDDGSQVDIRDINNKLLMIHGDMHPMSIDEVNSIYAPRQAEVIPETKLPNGEVIPERAPTGPPPVDQINHHSTVNTAPHIQPVAQPVVNPFAMFNSDETEITIKVNVKMPDKKLLKMMYSNAEDKGVFIDQLSKYVTSMINNNVVNESIAKMLDPNVAIPKKEEKPEVNLTPIDEKQ